MKRLQQLQDAINRLAPSASCRIGWFLMTSYFLSSGKIPLPVHL